MRFGFVAASLSVHAAAVCLAWRLAPEGLPPTRAPAPVSGLVAQEYDVTRWEGPAAAASPPETVEVNPDPPRSPPPRAETPKVDNPKPLAPKPLAAKPQRQVRSPAAAPGGKQAANADDDASQPSDGGDWLSLDQQLPDPKPQSTAASAQVSTPRDELVERLLAKERDKALLAARDERNRRHEARTAASSPPPSNPETSTAALPSEDEAWGESRSQADVWVELTRWLPRAASSDPAWEHLPTDTRYEFHVEITTESGKIVATKVSSGAPAAAEKLVATASHLMSRGRYGGTRRRVHEFDLRIRLSNTQGRDLWIAHTTPDPPKPGVGSFIAPSGRRFDVWVSAAE